MNLVEFDFSDLPPNPSIVLAGKRRSGKNVLCKSIAFNYFRGKVKNCFVFSPTAEIAINGYDYIPFEFRYTEVDIDVIDRIMKRQEYLIRNNPKGDYRILIFIDDIISSNGSVQHLDFLSDEEKEVYKTADELDQLDIVRQARQRQQYICQGQSVNLFFKPKADPKYVNQVHLAAFSLSGVGRPLKGLYYLRTENGSKTDKLNEKKERVALIDAPKKHETIECIGCEG